MRLIMLAAAGAAALAASLMGAPAAQAGRTATFTPRPVTTTSSALGYLEHLPAGYRSRGPKSPLLVFLHGYGESGAGTEEELPVLTATGLPQLIQDGAWPATRPFVVLAPQNPWETDDSIYDECLADRPAFLGSCLMGAQHDAGHPPDAAYCFTPDEVHDFVRFALAHYNVDPRRVYVTGLSCGGFAAWEYAAQHPGEVAAIVPIAGEGRPAWSSARCTLASVPVWAFHGLLDPTVDPRGSTAPVRRLRHCEHHADARLTLYPDADHGDPVEPWTRTYDLSAGHDIYAWLLRHRLSVHTSCGRTIRPAVCTC